MQSEHSLTCLSPPAEPVSDPLLAVLPNTGDVSEGQDLTLSCFVQRGTFPIRFTWYHTKRQAPLGFQISDKLEASFSLKNIRGEDQGGYYCETTNSANQTKQSQTVTIGGRTCQNICLLVKHV